MQKISHVQLVVDLFPPWPSGTSRSMTGCTLLSCTSADIIMHPIMLLAWESSSLQCFADAAYMWVVNHRPSLHTSTLSYTATTWRLGISCIIFNGLMSELANNRIDCLDIDLVTSKIKEDLPPNVKICEPTLYLVWRTQSNGFQTVALPTELLSRKNRPPATSLAYWIMAAQKDPTAADVTFHFSVIFKKWCKVPKFAKAKTTNRILHAFLLTSVSCEALATSQSLLRSGQSF